MEGFDRTQRHDVSNRVRITVPSPHDDVVHCIIVGAMDDDDDDGVVDDDNDDE